MKRQASLALVLPLTLLAACASDPAPEPAPPPAAKVEAPPVPASEPVKPAVLSQEELKPWLGLWLVTEAYGAAESAQPAKPPVGQRLLFAEGSAGDIDGRTCPQAGYLGGQLSEAAFLGLKQAGDESLKQLRPELSVSCGADAFGRYLLLKDGSLLTLADGKPLRLARQPDMKMAEDKKAPEKAEHEEPKQAEAKHEEMKHGAESPGHLLYLASYRDKETAMAGWKELAKVSPMLSKASPELTKLTIPGKGNFLRLQAKGLSEADGARLCKSLIKMLPDCGAKGRS